MQVSVESISNIERRLTISVPIEQVDQAFDKRIVNIAKTAKVNGFRPGKVPLDRVKQMYGDRARQEALSEVIQSSLYTALQQENINPVSTPMVEPKAFMPGQPLEYIARVEVLPTIETVNFKVDKFEKEVTEPNDQDVQTVLDKLLEQHIQWKIVNRAAQMKDQVLMNFVGKIDGVPFAGGTAENYPIVLGSNMMIAGFEDGLVGVKAGEERVINISFPEEYFAKEVAGKAAEFTVQVKHVSAPELPPMDEAFIKRLGIKSGLMSELQSEVKKNLGMEVKRLIKAKFKSKVFNQLLEQNAIEIPKGMIEREASRLHDQMHPHHKGEDHGHSEQEMAMFNDGAKQNVTLGLLVGEIIKKHSLTVDIARVDTHIREMAAAYEKPEEIVNILLKDKKRRAEIEMQVLEEQVLEKLLEGVQVTEKSVPYADFVMNQG